MHDVAEIADVSVQTVSNYVNGRLSKLSVTTQHKVQSAIDELGYRLNQTARGLRSTRTRTLAFLAVDDDERFLADPLTGNYLAGLSHVARESGYSVLMHSVSGDPETDEFLRPIHEGRVDAVCVLLSGPLELRRRLLRRLDESSTEYLVFDETDVVDEASRAMTVRAEQAAGARLLVEHLARNGHRHIAFIAARTPWAVVEQRHEGYLAALAEHSLPVRPELSLFEAGWEPSGAAAMVAKLLAIADPPSALLCGSDLLALGATRYLHDQGLRVPQDIAVCGYDDFDFARHCNPALTTVGVPAWEMGRRAGHQLIDVLDDPQSSRDDICLETTLIIRDSA
jgi:DNA-binding LacI/PurR family transcriptional regulator